MSDEMVVDEQTLWRRNSLRQSTAPVRMRLAQ